MRRLPVYLLLDCSGSMYGEPIEAVKNGVQVLVSLRYDLDEDFSVETAVEFGRLYKRNGQWKFEAIGTGQKAGLGEYLNKYN